MSSAARIFAVVVAAALAGVLAACGPPSQRAHPAAASPAGASTAGASPASTAAIPVRVQSGVVGWSGMVQRPQAIYVGMGGAPVVQRLSWHHWGSPSAWASGTLDIYWPQAGPISSWHPTTYPVTVRLQRIQTHDGQPSYRHMAYRYVNRRGMPKFLRFTFSVRPGGSLPSWNELGLKRPAGSASPPGVV